MSCRIDRREFVSMSLQNCPNSLLRSSSKRILNATCDISISPVCKNSCIVSYFASGCNRATDLWLPDYKADDDALHVKFTGVSNKVIRENLKRLVTAKANLEVRCLAVPNCTDGADLAARHAYLNSIGVPESSIVNLEYFDYARSKYLALGMEDTMPPKS